MPKLKDYEPLITTIFNYFSKNKGLNTVTAAVAVPAVATVGTSELLLNLVGAEVAGYLAGGPAGWIAAGLIIAARAGLAIHRRRQETK